MRIAVKGTSGSGKTTTAAMIAERLTIPHIELDVLNWGPGWLSRSESARGEFGPLQIERIRTPREIPSMLMRLEQADCA